MTFEHPWLLLLLVVPLLLAVLETRRPGQTVVLPFDHACLKPHRSIRGLLRFMHLLGPLMLSVAVIALAGPQKQQQRAGTRLSTNIEFCLDVSLSMNLFPNGTGTYEAPNSASNREQTRYEVATEAIENFTKQREGDSFGLTIFAAKVLHWLPLTQDLDAIRRATPFLTPGLLPADFQGTMIVKALRASIERLLDRPEGDRMIVLVTDGESYELRGGRSAEVADELAAQDIVTYVIHVTPFEVPREMIEIAEMTGGRAFAAGDEARLREVFARIDRMQPVRYNRPTEITVPHFRPVALAAMFLSALFVTHLLAVRYTPW